MNIGEPSLAVQERKERKSKRGDDRLDDAGQKIDKTYQVRDLGSQSFRLNLFTVNDFKGKTTGFWPDVYDMQVQVL